MPIKINSSKPIWCWGWVAGWEEGKGGKRVGPDTGDRCLIDSLESVAGIGLLHISDH